MRGALQDKNANRRSRERKQPERVVWCKLGAEESSSVLNFSEDGLCFESLTPIEEEGLLQVRLSVDLNRPIEATGRLAWIDSAKRRGGLRFLELSAQARQQIRAWLSKTSAASSGRNERQRSKQASDLAAPETPVILQATHVRSTQLVPIKRHRAQKRRLLLLGVLLGFGICTGVMIAISRYAGGAKPGTLPWTTPSSTRAAQSSTASAVQTALPSAPILQPTASVAAPSAPRKLPQNQGQTQSQKQTPHTATASPTNLMTSRTSSPPPRNMARPADGQVDGPLKGHVEGPVGGQVQRPKKIPPTPQQLWSALQAGNMKAAVALADLYARGEGVPVNCQQARILLQIASAKKNAEGTRKLQELDKTGCPANSPTE